MKAATRPRPFATRGPLGPWAIWVREQRQDHGWSETDLASVLWGEDVERQSGQVRRWEAGHWNPGEEACRRLVAAFGTAPAGIEVPAATYGGSTDEHVPARAAIADAFTAARTCLGYDPDQDPYRPALYEDTEALADAADLSDLDADHLQHDQDDEDGWDL